MQIAPITAAGFMGDEHVARQAESGVNQQKGLVDIMRMQQEMEHNAQMNPLRAKHLGAQTEGLVLGNRKAGMENDVYGRTMESTIDATNTGNRVKGVEAKVKEVTMMQGLAEQAAHRFGGIQNPMERTIATAEFFKQNGFDPQTNPSIGKLITADPQQLLASAAKMNKWIAENSPEFHAQAAKDAEALKRTKYTADASERSSKYSADKSAEARIAAAASKAKNTSNDILQRLKEGRVSPANAAAQFEVLAAMAENDMDREKFNRLAETMNKLALQMRPNPQNPDLAAAGITPAQPPAPVAGQGGRKPQGSGTKDDPIKLD
jgi:hypothetical protein